MFAYDYVITFGQEVQYIWMHKKTGAICLFLAVWYLALLVLMLLESMSYIPMSDHVRVLSLPDADLGHRDMDPHPNDAVLRLLDV